MILLVDVPEDTTPIFFKSWSAFCWREVSPLPRLWEFSTISLARSSSLCRSGTGFFDGSKGVREVTMLFSEGAFEFHKEATDDWSPFLYFHLASSSATNRSNAIIFVSEFSRED